jgi:hypothetical protein
MGAKKFYTKTWCNKTAKVLPQMFKDGQSKAEVAAALGISRPTFDLLISEHETFREAYQLGKTLSEAWWTKVGRAASAGKLAGANGSMWIFNMKNRFDWSDKQEIKIGEAKEDLTPWGKITAAEDE